MTILVQGVINNLSPLLFIIFSSELGLSFVQLSLLITLNFTLQIAVDFLSSFISGRLGYRTCIVMANILAATGLISIPLLVEIIPDSFSALCISTVIMSFGSGLIEVFVSPIISALPEDNKSSTMNLLHSFYCWGQVAVVCISTLYFTVIGIENWRFLPVLWSIIPIICAVMLSIVPIFRLEGDNTPSSRFKSLAKNASFWIMMVIMLCAGASELGLSQWASLYCEVGLGVSKTLGDLLGPCSFAIFMGCGRVLFSKFKPKRTEIWICISFFVCTISYLITAFASKPALSLFGFALCGISVSLLWPGTYSMGNEKLPNGGSLVFALFAMMGDIGCSLGPDIIGVISEKAQESKGFFNTLFTGSDIEIGMKSGILVASFIPLLGFIISLVYVFIIKGQKRR